MKMKSFISNKLNTGNLGRELLFFYKKYRDRIPEPDLKFPELVGIEIASSCNLSCIHCPPHLRKFKDDVRKFGVIDIDLFEKLMNEIDNYGKRKLALHKDGEPLLHPKINHILKRVKKNIDHTVYLTTNAHPLTEEVSKSILSNKIDVINFSIGAATNEFYKKVRGKNFDKVINNILLFLKLRDESDFKPKVIVQIINLTQFPEMNEEVKLFNDFWSKYDVEIQKWENLTWGVFEQKEKIVNRYPCFSLWDSATINSDGKVSACCMDWKQKLITGDSNNQLISEIWQGKAQQHLRKMHVEKKENELPICSTCNYWSWQQRLVNYPIQHD